MHEQPMGFGFPNKQSKQTGYKTYNGAVPALVRVRDIEQDDAKSVIDIENYESLDRKAELGK